MYIMCVCLFSALSRRVGALQMSIIIIIIIIWCRTLTTLPPQSQHTISKLDRSLWKLQHLHSPEKKKQQDTFKVDLQ